ncbi:TPA: helix-turn-helix domain-containing protein [Vibrio parahaemolyticus]
MIEDQVRKALNESRLSNSEIARRCNVARSTVGLWKQGKAIRSKNLSELCVVLGIDLSNNQHLRPTQQRVIQLISALDQEHDDVLLALEKMLMRF